MISAGQKLYEDWLANLIDTKHPAYVEWSKLTELEQHAWETLATKVSAQS